MIEPPGQSLRGGILEINDCILVRIKQVLIKQVTRAMQQSCVIHFSFRVNSLFIETSESCSRSHAVKAMAVIEKAKFHIGSQKERDILATAGGSGKGGLGQWSVVSGLWSLAFGIWPLEFKS
jgi:hypothetical protein